MHKRSGEIGRRPIPPHAQGEPAGAQLEVVFAPADPERDARILGRVYARILEDAPRPPEGPARPC